MGDFVWLRQGDKLPAVAVARLLLKRTGIGLTVDGDFGPRTRAAVLEFQRGHMPLTPDGVIGEKTWPRLRNNERLGVIDGIDVFDPLLFNIEARQLRQSGGNTILIGGMSNGIEQAVSEVVSRAAGNFLVRFHGDGASGLAGATMGQGHLGNHGSGFDRSAPALRAISRPSCRRGTHGCIQFMHCSVASGAEGPRFLRAVADATAHPASAGVQIQ